MNGIFRRLKQEFLGVIPAAIYFFVAFQLLAFTRSLTLLEYDIELSAFVTATVGALIVAKVVMVVDLLPFVNRFPDKPLMYNVAWKTGIYMIATLLFRYLERLIRLLFEYGGFVEANRHMFREVVWPHFLIVHIWLFVLFLMYCVFRELVRVFGRDRMREVFLGPARSPDV